jgi:hypothetical protein
MTVRGKIPSVKAPLVTTLTVLVMLLATGPAGALYPPVGEKPTGDPADPYMNPDDGVCVVGVAIDGTMLVDWNITNARDCVAYTTGLTGMTATDVTATSTCGATGTSSCGTQGGCTRPNGTVAWSAAALKCYDTSACTLAGAPGNDGYKHTFAMTNTCVDDANPAVAISLVDLDRTVAMCRSKGGTTLSPVPGTCVAYGWRYRNRKPSDNSLPVSGVGVGTTDGVQAADGLGFCYTPIRMTGGSYVSPPTPYNGAVTACPSYHNAATTAPGGLGGGEWAVCLSSTAGCQTQAAYDAGLGWSFSSGNCVYNFGLTGPANTNVITAGGVVTTAGTSVDPSQYTNEGDCLANGFLWDNWLPSAGTVTRSNVDGGDYAGMPAGAVIRRFDALTPIEGGGGEFFSGTGFNCLRCHADQSRAYQERDKPGFVKTRHARAGEDPAKPFAGYFMTGSSSWGLQGVVCTMCHSTARPSQDDLIQIVPAGVVGPPTAGDPKSASGHNQTEYGAHLLDICYTCHGSPASPTTTNPASVIPVFAGDFALTDNTPGPATSNLFSSPTVSPPNVGGLAPIMNQFLNSPHAQYGGDSLKVNLGNKNNYGSTFKGYICRTGTVTTQTACTNAGNTWNTVFDPNVYPGGVANGGVCSGIGVGSIITTLYQSGVAKRIHNLDSTTNADCTNFGDGGSTSGASGFWVPDGETSPGNPTNTAQGNCMTCHDLHWGLADTNPAAESFRRECTTCHTNNPASASGAPQIDLATINHSKAAGTPLEHWLTKPAEACETCHMPKSGGSESSPMHLWRINPDSAYTTMGATQANLAPDVEAGYTDAAWVDIDHACGQCHGTDGITAAKPGVPPYTKAQLAQVAEGMHDSAGVSYPVTFSIAKSGLQVNVDASADCGAPCPDFTYDWDWGDGSPHGTADPDSHTYASGGTKSITLKVSLLSNGKEVGSVTRSVTLANPDMAPTVAGTCNWNANTWTMQVVDSSSDDGPDADAVPPDGNATLKISLKWGDSSTNTNTTQGATVNHTYRVKGTYTVTQTAVDSKLQKAQRNCETGAVTAAPFQITGTVQAPAGTPLGYALVRLFKGTTAIKSLYTASNGTFTLTGLAPYAYTVKVTKTGYTFPASIPATVGPSLSLGIITGTKP